MDTTQAKFKKPCLQEEISETVCGELKVKKGKKQKPDSETKNEVVDNTPIKKKRKLGAIESEGLSISSKKRKNSSAKEKLSSSSSDSITTEQQCLNLEESPVSQGNKGKGKSKRRKLTDRESRTDESTPEGSVVTKSKGKRSKPKEKLKGRKQGLVDSNKNLSSVFITYHSNLE